jgi:hypothetical protein
MNPTPAEPEAAAAHAPQSYHSQPGPMYYVRKGLKALASLQLTVVLFALSILLVFFGTVAQMDNGIWTVVSDYFWSWCVWVPFDLFNKFGQVFISDWFPRNSHWEGSFPFPGGKLLGGAMLLNLLAAHLIRFKLAWKRSGVLLIHGGIILMFCGEFITREYAVEQRMTIDEGSSTNYTDDTRHYELAIVDASDPNAERVTVIPETMLRKAEGRITHPDLPVDLEVVEYMVNSVVERITPVPGQRNQATAGQGTQMIAVKKSEVSGVDPNQKIDTPSAYIRLYKKGTKEELGTYLVSLRLTLMGLSDIFELDGKKFDVSYRFKRYYKPYSLHLKKFTFARYPGTQKPKDYASEVILRDPEYGVEREVTIRMNEPLRHRGETFYQSSFDDATEKTTILSVVKNPGWQLPYWSCAIVAAGMLLHFGMYLTKFLVRRAAA